MYTPRERERGDRLLLHTRTCRQQHCRLALRDIYTRRPQCISSSRTVLLLYYIRDTEHRKLMEMSAEFHTRAKSPRARIRSKQQQQQQGERESGCGLSSFYRFRRRQRAPREPHSLSLARFSRRRSSAVCIYLLLYVIYTPLYVYSFFICSLSRLASHH